MLTLSLSLLNNSGNFRRFKSFLIFFRVFSFSDEIHDLIDEKMAMRRLCRFGCKERLAGWSAEKVSSKNIHNF